MVPKRRHRTQMKSAQAVGSEIDTVAESQHRQKTWLNPPIALFHCLCSLHPIHHCQSSTEARQPTQTSAPAHNGHMNRAKNSSAKKKFHKILSGS